MVELVSDIESRVVRGQGKAGRRVERSGGGRPIVRSRVAVTCEGGDRTRRDVHLPHSLVGSIGDIEYRIVRAANHAVRLIEARAGACGIHVAACSSGAGEGGDEGGDSAATDACGAEHWSEWARRRHWWRQRRR